MTSEVRNGELEALLSRKRVRNEDANTKLRKIECLCSAQLKMLNAISEVEQVFNDRQKFAVRNKNFMNMKSKFYKEVEAIGLDLFTINDTEICPFEINKERNKETMKSMKRSENLRSHGTKELKWSTVIEELGYQGRWKERVECGRLGAKYKQSVGNDKSYAFKSKQKSWVFYEEDRPAMEEIVRYVYRDT